MAPSVFRVGPGFGSVAFAAAVGTSAAVFAGGVGVSSAFDDGGGGGSVVAAVDGLAVCAGSAASSGSRGCSFQIVKASATTTPIANVT